MATAYMVTAGAVIARYEDHAGEGYFYQGAVLPDIVSEQEKKRLVDVGLVEKIDIVDVVPEPVAVDPTEGLDLDGLKAYAVEHEVDLGKATSEDGIRQKILEARAS